MKKRLILPMIFIIGIFMAFNINWSSRFKKNIYSNLSLINIEVLAFAEITSNKDDCGATDYKTQIVDKNTNGENVLISKTTVYSCSNGLDKSCKKGTIYENFEDSSKSYDNTTTHHCTIAL